MKQVVLVRGPLPDKVFPREPCSRARQRAYALQDLHGRCQVNEDEHVITVEASWWYSRKKELRHLT